MVAVSADPSVVRQFAARLLSEANEQEPDAVIREREQVRRRALRLVRDGHGAD